MFKQKKSSQSKIFEAAMLTHKGKASRRRTTTPVHGSFPWAPFALWAAFSLVGGYVLFFSPSLSIREVSVEGGEIVSPTEYRAVVEVAMDGVYLGWLAKRNFFLIPSRSIEQTILERFPLVTGVSVTRQFPDRVVLHLTESPVFLRWCAGGPCYGVRHGIAVLVPAADESRYDALRLSVIDGSALPVAVGEALSIDTYLETFRTFHEQLPKFVPGTIPGEATTPSRYSGELTLLTGEGWRLTVSVERQPEESLGMLQVFLAEYTKEGKDRSRLASVDLRVEGKVFYVERDGPPTEAVLPTTTGSEEKPALKKKKKSGE